MGLLHDGKQYFIPFLWSSANLLEEDYLLLLLLMMTIHPLHPVKD